MSPVSHLSYKDILERPKKLKTSVRFRQMDWLSNKPVNVYQLTKRKTTPALQKVFPAKALQGQQPRHLLQEGELGTSAGTCSQEAPPGHPGHSHCWPTHCSSQISRHQIHGKHTWSSKQWVRVHRVMTEQPWRTGHCLPSGGGNLTCSHECGGKV